MRTGNLLKLPIPAVAAVLALAFAAPVPAADAGVREPVVTRHEGVFNGQVVRYRAVVSELVVPDADGNPGAAIVSTAYLAENPANGPRRPVLFAFNGGPISPSAYLHMGMLGPRRVHVPDDLSADPASFEVVDNAYTLLDVADIVFFDPAGTGFSRVVDGKNPRDYFSVVADGQQTAAFVTEWLRANGRESSPAWLFGESYGTMRAAEAARQLAEAGRSLAGVVLFGQALNIIEFSQRPGNIVSYVVSLPTLTALGLYHGKVDARGRDLETLLAESARYARTEYLEALFLGSALEPRDRARVARRLEELSGIPADFYLANGLRITKERYRTELLKDRNLILGRNDGRYAAPVTEAGNAFDPSGVVPDAYLRAFREHLREFLGIDWDEEYVARSPVKGLEDWSWGATSPFSDWPYMQLISVAMEKNPEFRVLVANGIHDTSTTIGAAEYAVRQSGWPEERTRLEFYVGGHMAYSIESTLEEMTDDLRELLAGAAN
ncbi:MAG TPA: hypothetical protein VKZ85_16545 [Woeseiaceae bacterium]|nr:hypothetical protein [Woeseiaceae bacterium]